MRGTHPGVPGRYARYTPWGMPKVGNVHPGVCLRWVMYTLGMVGVPVVHPGYGRGAYSTPWYTLGGVYLPVHPSWYTSLGTPLYSAGLLSCTRCQQCGTVRDNNTLGSNLEIIRGKRPPCAFLRSFLLRKSGTSAQSPSALPGE